MIDTDQRVSMDTQQDLPDGWRWARLGDVCEGRITTRDPRTDPDKPFTYVDISSIDTTAKTICEPKALLGGDAPSRARQVIRAGDVIVSTTRPNLNAVAIVPSELDQQICSTGFCVLRARTSIDPSYLFAFVQCREFVESLSALVKGALYPAVTDGQVRDQLIPLPPSPEQRRIAALLTEQMASVARARAAATAQLAAAMALPAAYLRAVFEGDEARKWPVRRIGDLTQTCSGSTPSRTRSDYFDGAIPWVKTGELIDGVIQDTEEHVSENAIRETSLKLLPPGTLLIAMYGQGQTRGRTGLLACAATTNQACFAVLLRPECFETAFLQYWFRHGYDRLRNESEGRGGNQPNLNGDLLRGQQVPLPSPSRQRHIAAALNDQMAAVERTRDALQQQLDAINALPAALLRQAFNGEL